MSSESRPVGRAAHLFTFDADVIAERCQGEAEYHRDRLRFWKGELDKSISAVKKSAKVEIKEYEITGGKRIDVGVDYGDGSAYRRMGESQQKIQNHRSNAERFEREAAVYGSQGNRTYELTPEDVHYFRLGDESRED